MSRLKLELVHVHLVTTKTSWPVAIVWLALSLSVALASMISFVQPEWFVREENGLSSVSDVSVRPSTGSTLSYNRLDLLYTLGMFGACYRDVVTIPALEQNSRMSCYNFGSDSNIVYFPSTWWQMSCILFGSGCLLLVGSALAAAGALWLVTEPVKRKTLVLVVGHVQIAAVVVQTMSLFIFPSVLASHFAQMHCGPGSDTYKPDFCQVGWAYVLAIVGTLLACYCPLLARYSSTDLYQTCYWTRV